MYLFFVAFIPLLFAEDKLIHIHSIWRHGQRNPWVLFNGDLNNASAFPEGIAQLTKKGVHQLYTLGQNYQKVYIKDLKFLSKNYVNTEVYARSTDFDRTLVSAMAFFSGLYSDGTNANHILVPIPIHTIPLEDDFLNILTLQCQRKNELWKMVDESQIIQSIYKNSHNLFSEVSNKTHVPLDFYKVYDSFDAGIVEQSFGLPVPPWFSVHFPEWKIILAKYASALWGHTNFPEYSMDLQTEIIKISAGSTIAEIVDRWQLKIKCQKLQEKECENIKDQKLYAYSGHDLTLIGLFAGLGFNNYLNVSTWPEHGSSVVLELWESDGDEHAEENYYFKIYFYQNSNVENPKYIGDLLPECQGQKGCPISYLIKRAELLRPKPDLKSFCIEAVISKASKIVYNIIILLFSFAFIF